MEVRNVLISLGALSVAGLIAMVVYMMENNMGPFDRPAPRPMDSDERIDLSYQSMEFELADQLPIDMGTMVVRDVIYDADIDVLSYEVEVKPDVLATASEDLIRRRAGEFFSCESIDSSTRRMTREISIEHVIVDSGGRELFTVIIDKGSCL